MKSWEGQTQCHQRFNIIGGYSQMIRGTTRSTNLNPSSLAMLTAWLSGSTLVSINEVTLRRARLVVVVKNFVRYFRRNLHVVKPGE